MKFSAKLKFSLLTLLSLLVVSVFGQGAYDPAKDDDFNVFLMLFATVFICGLFGAAVVGAMVASLIAILVFAMISFGILSTSIAIGLYRKSLLSGFKTFLGIVFGMGCGICGAALAAFVQLNWTIAPSFALTASLGFLGGCLGGILLSLVSMKAIRFIIAKAVKKLKLSG